MTTYRLSVVMIVKNEAENLRRCLPLIAPIADEIIILDSGSSDDSATIAAQYGAIWQESEVWQGYGVQRQRAQSLANGDWILALDADEAPDATLMTALSHIKNEKPENTVYGIRRLDFFLDKAIDSPSWRIKPHWRLYPRQFQFNANTVHESLSLKEAKTRVLPGFLLHYTGNHLYYWLTKRLSYAETWAKTAAARGKKSGACGAFFRSLWAFCKQYLINGRFLCGQYGWIYSWLFAQYTFNKYALLSDYAQRPQSYTAEFQPHDINIHHLPSIKIQENDKQQPTTDANEKPQQQPLAAYRLSVVLIVKNESRHLPACLAAIHDLADEIIILDSGSTDETAAIAAHFAAHWFSDTHWQGFGIQRQKAQAHANGDYILMLDADEQPDAALQTSIRQILQETPSAQKVYAVRRRNIFCGTTVHGWYRDGIVRLYPRAYFQYHPYEVHESLNTGNAQIVTLNGTLHHFTNDNLAHFIKKNLRYSHDWAQEKAIKGKKPTNLWCLPLLSMVSFCREYLIRGAICGGRYGFFLATSTAFYHFNKYLMLALTRRQKEDNP